MRGKFAAIAIYKIYCAVGAGQCPARDFTPTPTYQVTRRGGIYAARRNHPDNST